MKKLLVTILLLFALTACSSSYSVTLSPGRDIITENEEWIDEGCTLQLDEMFYEMTRVNDIDNKEIGEQTITYEYTSKNTTYTCKRIVKVLEAPDFNISLEKGLDTIKLNSTFVDAGLVFEDDNETDFIVDITSTVNTSKLGTYQVTYRITDEYGNVLVLERFVNVIW